MTLLRHHTLVLFAAVCCHAATNATVTLYNPDPGHVWNRVYATLLVRTLDDAVTYDDLLDPPLWENTKHLLAGNRIEGPSRCCGSSLRTPAAQAG